MVMPDRVSVRRHHRPAASAAGHRKRAEVRFRLPSGNEIGGSVKAVLPVRRAKAGRPALDKVGDALFAKEARGLVSQGFPGL
jgi:hypothetical protein